MLELFEYFIQGYNSAAAQLQLKEVEGTLKKSTNRFMNSCLHNKSNIIEACSFDMVDFLGKMLNH